MQFNTIPDADHELVRLRLIVPSDIPAWYEYLSDPAVFEHTSWNLKSPDDLSHYPSVSESREPSSLLRFAIADRSSDRLVGTIGFHTVSPENRSAELAYDLSPAVWGKGIAIWAVNTVVRWAHLHVGLIRVQATSLISNARSVRVLERCAFEREGLLRSYRQVRGRPGDFLIYAHVRDAA